MKKLSRQDAVGTRRLSNYFARGPPDPQTPQRPQPRPPPSASPDLVLLDENSPPPEVIEELHGSRHPAKPAERAQSSAGQKAAVFQPSHSDYDEEAAVREALARSLAESPGPSGHQAGPSTSLGFGGPSTSVQAASLLFDDDEDEDMDAIIADLDLDEVASVCEPRASTSGAAGWLTEEGLDDDEIMALDLDELSSSVPAVAEVEVLGEEEGPVGAPEEVLEGFDVEAGRAWYYPEPSERFPTRQYQKSMVRGALFANSLVSLPTGLGKTLIAAVLMYNFYRWYPGGKVVFLCPTRPLVAQQIAACYQLMGIPQGDMVELTGSRLPRLRAADWTERRVFFLTPQTMVSDLKSKVCPAKEVRCVVFDEAHRAQGNYAYCEILRWLVPVNPAFRVLALSATPGADLQKVQAVVENLLISRLDLRTDQSLDVTPYVQGKKLDKVVVKMTPELLAVRGMLAGAMSGTLRKLRGWGAVQSDRVEAYNVMSTRALIPKFVHADRNFASAVKGTLAFLSSMYHLLDQLECHGMRSLYAGIKAKRTEKPRVWAQMTRDPAYARVMQTLEASFASLSNFGLDASVNFGGSLDETALPPTSASDSVQPTASQNLEDEKRAGASHPKFPKLKEILLGHFASAGEDSRVMVFSSFRNSVSEIVDYLLRFGPTLRPVEFKGQSAGGAAGRRGSAGKGRRSSSAAEGTDSADPPSKRSKSTAAQAPQEGAKKEEERPKPKRTTQKKQLATVEAFKAGTHNVLVSTSVGEEGLDIGEVDLTVCFDAPKSGIRLVQRCGRTGRKRQGRVVLLLTEGIEERKYERSHQGKTRVNEQMASSKLLQQGRLVFEPSPRMVPKGLRPQCTFVPPPQAQEPFDAQLHKPKRKGSKEARAQEDGQPSTSAGPKKASGAFKKPPAPMKERQSKKKAGVAERLTGKAGGKGSGGQGARQKLRGPSPDPHEVEYPLVRLESEEEKAASARRKEMAARLGEAAAKPPRDIAQCLLMRRLRKAAEKLPKRTRKKPRCSTLQTGLAETPSFKPPDTAPSEPLPSATSDRGLSVRLNLCDAAPSKRPQEPAVEEPVAEEPPEEDRLDLGFDFAAAPSPAHQPAEADEQRLELGFDFTSAPSPAPESRPPSSLRLGFDFDASLSPSHPAEAEERAGSPLDLGFDFAAAPSPSGEAEEAPDTSLHLGFDFDTPQSPAAADLDESRELRLGFSFGGSPGPEGGPEVGEEEERQGPALDLNFTFSGAATPEREGEDWLVPETPPQGPAREESETFVPLSPVL